jgi:hypothetical protein
MAGEKEFTATFCHTFYALVILFSGTQANMAASRVRNPAISTRNEETSEIFNPGEKWWVVADNQDMDFNLKKLFMNDDIKDNFFIV